MTGPRKDNLVTSESMTLFEFLYQVCREIETYPDTDSIACPEYMSP